MMRRIQDDSGWSLASPLRNTRELSKRMNCELPPLVMIAIAMIMMVCIVMKDPCSFCFSFFFTDEIHA
jgi:hypothetical protein